MFFLFLLLCLVFIIGGGLSLIGLISKNHRSLIKAGLIICCIPIAMIVIPLFFGGIINSFKHKPASNELVGEYQIAEIRNLDFDKATYKKYKLILKKDSTFILTPTPYIEICDSGSYAVDYSFEFNEISYRCGMGYIPSHIDRQFGNFRIEFIVGDPDSGQSIFFEKVKAENN